LLLDHVPPPVPVSVVLAPVQTVPEPVIAPGVALTVTVDTAKQPVGTHWQVIFTEPAATPVTTPVEMLTVAIAGLKLVQANDGQTPLLASVVVPVVHTVSVPVFAGGVAFTVKAFVTKQLPGLVV
jgi:hypothetical protein